MAHPDQTDLISQPSKVALIYALCEPGTAIVRYVGKCLCLQLRLRQHCAEARRSDRKSHRCNWIRSLGAEKPTILLLERVVSGDWQERERYWIAFHRKGAVKLTNATSGGEGLINPTEDVRRRIGAAKIGNQNCVGRVMSEETRRLIGAAHKGRRHTTASKELMSFKQSGRKHTEETKIKIGNAHRGRKLPQAQIEAARLAQVGAEFSAEHRNKISAASRGKPKSVEHRAAISKALGGRSKQKVSWIAAISAQLPAAGGLFTADQIWQRISASGFQHTCSAPRRRLVGCLSALIRANKVERAGRANYRVLEIA